MPELTDLTASEAAQLVRQRELSPVTLVEALLRHIERLEPRLQAWVTLDHAGALAAAQQLAAEAEQGSIRGPLHGVPFTVKDIFDVAGVVSAAGIEERAAFVPERDAVVVARLRGAGAILIGKTNCPPWGAGVLTDNPVYGATSNPYDLGRSPSGSSGGEAAILAAGGSPLGLGSDSGGSLRMPAHYCGVTALRPTVGRVPNTGALELLLLEDGLQLAGWVRALGVVPQPDVLDRRSLPRLLQVGPASQQRDRAVVGGQYGALEKDEAARVEAGQVIVALLRKQQNSVQAVPLKRRPCARFALARYAAE